MLFGARGQGEGDSRDAWAVVTALVAVMLQSGKAFAAAGEFYLLISRLRGEIKQETRPYLAVRSCSSNPALCCPSPPEGIVHRSSELQPKEEMQFSLQVAKLILCFFNLSPAWD